MLNMANHYDTSYRLGKNIVLYTDVQILSQQQYFTSSAFKKTSTSINILIFFVIIIPIMNLNTHQ